MSAATWRTIALALALACVVLGWRSCHPPRRAPAVTIDGDEARCPPASHEAGVAMSGARTSRPAATPEDGEDVVDAPAPRAFGVTIPPWLQWFALRPGEDLLAYRDRLLPIVQAAVAPQRARVDRGRAAFEAAARLDAGQRAELDTAVEEAADAIKDRVMQGVLSGELLPGQLRPSSGVAFARDVLDLVDGANRRFDATLRPEQRDAMAAAHFDVVDYLVCSTRWEDLLGATSE